MCVLTSWKAPRMEITMRLRNRAAALRVAAVVAGRSRDAVADLLDEAADRIAELEAALRLAKESGTGAS